MSTNKERYMNKRLEKVEERKVMVIDKAKELFLDRGLHKVTMNDLMKEAGLSKATMYRYFDSIHPIAFEVQYQMVKEIYRDIRLQVDDVSEGDQALKKVLFKMVEQFHKHIKAYSYISMFDHFYASTYPNQHLSLEYGRFLEQIFSDHHKEAMTNELKGETLTYIDFVATYLQKLAVRKEVINQDVLNVDERLEYLKKMIEKLL